MITLAHSVESTKTVAHLTLFTKIAGNNNRLKYLCYGTFVFGTRPHTRSNKEKDGGGVRRREREKLPSPLTPSPIIFGLDLSLTFAGLYLLI